MIVLTLNIQENWSSIVLAFEKNQYWIGIQVAVLPEQTVNLLGNFTESILEFIWNFSGNLLNTTVATTTLFISRTGTFSCLFISCFLISIK